MKHSFHLNATKALTFFLLFAFFASHIAMSQDDPKVVIQMKKENKIKNVNEGKKVRVWYEGERYSGYIDSIGADAMYMDGKEFEVDKIEKIGIKFKGTIITSAVVGTAGLLFTSLGTYMIIDGTNSGNLAGVIVVLFGVIIDVVAIPVTVVGGSIAFIGKKYKKEKGWDFSIVQLE